MAVYVDAAMIPYRGMRMSHLWADSLDELLCMVDRIGVSRRWIQQPPKASWIHFDICATKRALAVRAGAKETDRYGPVEHVARLRGDTAKLDLIADLRRRRALSSSSPTQGALQLADAEHEDAPGRQP